MVTLLLFPLLLFAQEDTFLPVHTKKISFTWDQLLHRKVPRTKVYVISTASDLDAIPPGDSIRIVRGKRSKEFLLKVDHSPAVAESFKGSPYLYVTARPGTLTNRNGDTYEQVPLRYDLYKDCLEYSKEGRPVILDPADVRGFLFMDSLTGQPRLFQNGFEPPAGFNLGKRSYYEVLYDGPTKLLRHLKKEPFNKVDGSPHNAVLHKGTYVFSTVMEEYFLLKQSRMVPIKARRSQVLGALKDQEEQLLDFIKTNNIDVGDPEGIKKVLFRYDQLTQEQAGSKEPER